MVIFHSYVKLPEGTCLILFGCPWTQSFKRFSFYWPKEFAGNLLYFMVNIVISGRFSQPIHWIHCSLPSRLANSKQPRQVMLCTSETGKLKWEKLRNTEDLYRDPHFISFHHLIKWDFQYVTAVQPPQSGLVQVCHEDILPQMRFSCGSTRFHMIQLDPVDQFWRIFVGPQ